jgi:hypothetical protein
MPPLAKSFLQRFFGQLSQVKRFNGRHRWNRFCPRRILDSAP